MGRIVDESYILMSIAHDMSEESGTTKRDSEDFAKGMEYVIEKIKSAPTVCKRQFPTAHCVKKDGMCLCSNCGESVTVLPGAEMMIRYGEKWIPAERDGKHCRNCGALLLKGEI